MINDRSFMMLPVYFLLFPLLTTLTALETITPSHSMKDGQTLVSAGKIFELGFFSPSMSSRRYLGIWYIISKSAVVWVANRENPLTDHSRVLNISRQGILVLLNGTKEVVWSSNTSGTAQKPIAKLLQSENLVVKDENDDSEEKFLWQSFDYPSDTLLPGMKLGKNLVTGLNKVISSWKDTDDPARGKFTQEIDLHGYPQSVLLNRHKIA